MLHFGRGMLGVAMFLALPALLITRCILLMWLNLEILESRAIVLGTGTKAQECVEICKMNPKQKGLEDSLLYPVTR